MFFGHHRALVRAYHEEQRKNRCYELLGRLVVWAAWIAGLVLLIRRFQGLEEEKKSQKKG